MKDFLAYLEKYQIYLASRSPRRHSLLSELKIPFSIWLKEEVEEIFPDHLSPVEVALYLARHKALAYLGELGKEDILITADTIVVLEQRILGKPGDRDDALRLLTELAGRSHEVITGVGLWSAGRELLFDSRTKVWFDPLTRAEIEEYIDAFNPYDKAGAYGIQEWIGYIGIGRIEGSFYNVMGLPIQRLYRELQRFTEFSS